MIIKKIAIGNESEAFIEDRFTNNLNIIFSDDNNRGKTIVLQGMMYALGNNPIFPESFNYQDYTYILEIEINNETFYISRNKNSFVINHNGIIDICDSVTEFKYFFDKNICKLPIILKDDKAKTVDLELFVQLFFIGQDKKNTSNIINPGYYNKEDFINMILAFDGIQSVEFDKTSLVELKNEIKKLEQEKKIILKKHKIFKDTNACLSSTNYVNDSESMKIRLERVEKLNKLITELLKDRNRTINRKIKNQQVLSEIESLNKSLNVGKLTCKDCGSDNVEYISASNDFSFDISSKEIRSQIKNTIKNRIQIYEEEIELLTSQINVRQNQLKDLLKSDDIKTSDILLYKDEIIKASEDDNYIKKIDDKLKQLKSKVKLYNTSLNINIDKAKELIDKIIKEMNSVYNQIDPNGNIKFESLFSKRNTTYSGSEATEYFLSKMISLTRNLKHNFPIIIDHFRGGELSSNKESIVLEIFRSFMNQIILTATLKTQELGKYNNITWINAIDFSMFQSNKLLQPQYVDNFKKLYSQITMSAMKKTTN